MIAKNIKRILKKIEPLTFLVFNFKRLRYKAHRQYLRAILAYVSQRTAKPVALVGIDLFVKCLAACALYSEYTVFHLYERSLAEAWRFCGYGRQTGVLPAMKSKEAIQIYDVKPLFLKVFNRFTGRESLYIANETPYEVFERFLERHPVFIAKPPQANAGRGVWLVERERFESGEEILATLRKRQTTLIEERVKNHPVLERFSHTSLNTMRLITLRLPEGVILIGAFLKFNTTGGIADNIGDGRAGYLCPVDINTGKTGNVMKIVYGSCEVIEYKPDGYTLPETQIPYWQEAVEMAKQATLLLDDVYFVPWDIAVSPDGPLIIEGNNVPSFSFQQINNRPCNRDMQRARRFAQKNERFKRRSAGT